MKLARPIISPILFSLFFLVFALGLFVAPNDAQAQPDAPLSFTPSAENIQAAPRAPGVVLVGLKPNATMSRSATGVQSNNATLNTRLARLGAQSVERVFPFVRQPRAVTAVGRDVDLTRIYRLRLAPNADVLRAVQELRADPSVAYAEPDYLAHVIATPNDPEFANQWGLTKINAPAAWDTTTGSNDVVIAVVDAGIDATHPDLSGQLWTNPGEIAGNGIDDDSDGYVDDIRGWNIIGNNADLSDNTGHGTQVAGVIAAATNNSAGIAGVCWNCRLMIVKVMQPSGVANYSDIATGVAYAAQKGAKVINLSLGGSSDSTTLKAAVASASSTAVIVGGAGNDNSSAAFYPAAYDDYVLAVAGTTDTDAKVGSSNYGTWVDVSAPGAAIRTTFSGGTYADSSGTSMAAPFAAGLAGLIRSQNPTWSANLTRAQIVNTTDNIDSANPGFAGKLGSGRINAQKAVTMAATPQLSIVSYTTNGVTSGTPAPGSTVNLIVTIRNTWGTVTNATGTLSTSDPYVTITGASASYGNIDAYSTTTNTTPFVFSVSSSVPYAHVIPLSLTINATGGFTTVLPVTITTQSGVQNVGGIISSDTVWTNDKTFLVVGNVLVSNGVTLTIQPGTNVKFNGSYEIVVKGQLLARGTAENRIIFTSNKAAPQPGDWKAIVFGDESIDAIVDSSGNYVGGSILEFAEIEFGGTVLAYTSSPYLANNYLHDNIASGSPYPPGYPWDTSVTTLYNSSSRFVNNIIENNQGGGVKIEGGSFITVSHSVIRNNRAGNWGGGITCLSGTCAIVNSDVRNNKGGSFSGGIFSYGGNVTISNSLIAGNSSMQSAGDRGGGAFGKWGGSIYAMNNTFFGNSAFTAFHFNTSSSLGSVPVTGEDPVGDSKTSGR